MWQGCWSFEHRHCSRQRRRTAPPCSDAHCSVAMNPKRIKAPFLIDVCRTPFNFDLSPQRGEREKFFNFSLSPPSPLPPPPSVPPWHSPASPSEPATCPGRPAPGIEPGTSRTRSENQATRPSSRSEPMLLQELMQRILKPSSCSTLMNCLLQLLTLLFEWLLWGLSGGKCIHSPEPLGQTAFECRCELEEHTTQANKTPFRARKCHRKCGNAFWKA